MRQPGLFESSADDVRIGEVVRFALGDFQSRGLELAGRRLALDRLLGAFRRAFEEFDIAPVADEDLASALKRAGALVEEVPGYVAKHPYRVTVSQALADDSLNFYRARRH